MNLISCENCGSVLDKKRIKVPDSFWIENDEDDLDCEVDLRIAAWDGDSYVPTIECPCCKTRIFYDCGDTVD
jgi:DNA-directed RNA polymerase subunit RPC12/RpoP